MEVLKSILTLSAGALCGYAIACIMFSSSRQSREEEKRETKQ